MTLKMTTKRLTEMEPLVQADLPSWHSGSGAEDLAETRIAAILGLKRFTQGPIRTLLIKGLAGTGKTTVALEILKAAGEGKGRIHLVKGPERASRGAHTRHEGDAGESGVLGSSGSKTRRPS